MAGERTERAVQRAVFSVLRQKLSGVQGQATPTRSRFASSFRGGHEAVGMRDFAKEIFSEILASGSRGFDIQEKRRAGEKE